MEPASSTPSRSVIQGHTYVIHSIPSLAQLEVECILAQMLGPVVINTIVDACEPVIEALVDRARDITFAAPPQGEGEEAKPAARRFDLEHLGQLVERFLDSDSDDSFVESAMTVVFDALPPAVSNALRTGGLALFAQMEWSKVLRLFELVIYKRVFLMQVKDGAETATGIDRLDTIDAFHGYNPLVKWQLLLAALRHTYGRRAPAESEIETSPGVA